MHLAHIRVGQAAEFQIDDDQAAQPAMKQQQIHAIPGLVDAQSTLPSHEGEAVPKFQQETFQTLRQGGFQVGFRVFVLEIEKLQHIRILDRIIRGDSIRGHRERCLGQHRVLVPGQCRALVELAFDLPVELAHAPAATQRMRLVEPASLAILDR
jgi:hypothetical protein